MLSRMLVFDSRPQAGDTHGSRRTHWSWRQRSRKKGRDGGLTSPPVALPLHYRRPPAQRKPSHGAFPLIRQPRQYAADSRRGCVGTATPTLCLSALALLSDAPLRCHIQVGESIGP